MAENHHVVTNRAKVFTAYDYSNERVGLAIAIKAVPSSSPFFNPTTEPTTVPSPIPTLAPSVDPTRVPQLRPTSIPSRSPTHQPLSTPKPTVRPTKTPTASPTHEPSFGTTKMPTSVVGGLTIILTMHAPNFPQESDELVVIATVVAASKSLGTMDNIHSYEVNTWYEERHLSKFSERSTDIPSWNETVSSSKTLQPFYDVRLFNRRLGGTATMTLITTSPPRGISSSAWAVAVNNELQEGLTSGALNRDLAMRCPQCALSLGRFLNDHFDIWRHHALTDTIYFCSEYHDFK
jgi:hypothetical protein